MNIALVGFGYWGPNILRNFLKIKNCKISYVCDISTQKLKFINRYFPKILTTNYLDDILSDDDVNAVIIVTPVSTHYKIARKCLQAQKHVLIEKPMTDSVTHANHLIKIAQQNDRILMVDHTYLYTSAIQQIKKLIKKGSIGKIQYLDSIRANLGLFRPDINVLWDLAPHDISICNYLFEEKPISVQAVGKSHTNLDLEDIAYLTLNYKTGKIAHFTCSWIFPTKIRQIIIGGTKKMIFFDDVTQHKKIQIFDSGFKVRKNKTNFSVKYRQGKILTPKLQQYEALQNMAEDFVNSIKINSLPVSNYQIGLDVVEILVAAQKSIKKSTKINL